MIVRELKKASNSHKEKIEQSFRVKSMLNKIQKSSKDLLLIYKDSGDSWKKEIEFFGGQGVEKDVYTLFYDRFKDITSFYRKFPHLTEDITGLDSFEGEVPVEITYPNFTGEEGFGCFLDLHVQLLHFMNSKFGSKCSYTEYIKEKMWAFHNVSMRSRKSNEYMIYLSGLLEYLESF